MSQSSLPVSLLSNAATNSNANKGKINEPTQHIKFSRNSCWNSFWYGLYEENRSIFAYQNWLWPKETDLERIESELSKQRPPWTSHLDLVIPDRSSGGIPYILFRLNEQIHVECELAKCLHSTQIAQRCRGINLVLQTQGRRWLIMKQIAKAMEMQELIFAEMNQMDQTLQQRDSSQVIYEPHNEIAESNYLAEHSQKFKVLSSNAKNLKVRIKVLEERLFKSLEKEYESVGCNAKMFKPGPVGDLPIHQCFVLDLKEIGTKIVNKYFSSPELISTPYKNDLDPWRKAKSTGVLNQKPREDGLYTGETILHIAIVKEDVDLVKHLLAKGASLTSRATGVFFQPSLLPLRVGELNSWQRAMAWAGGIDLTLDASAAMKQEPNRYSGCYYGELPLSFAASVGNVEICQLLYDCKTQRVRDRHCEMPEDELPAGPDVQKQIRDMLLKLNPHRAEPAAEKPPCAVRDFVTAVDAFCNTAMHMAVIHRRKEAVDWLMSIDGGRACLETLNCSGFTPLTLAVHEGHVDMFNHILYTHMSSVVWRYGRVRMRQTDLLQVDTFRLGGGPGARPHLHANPRWRSALEVIATHEVQAFARNDIFNRLIEDKWRRFGRSMYLRRTVLPYALLLAVFAACVVLRADELHRDRPRDDASASPRLFCVQDAAGWALAGSLGDGGGDGGGVGGDAGRRMATLVLEGVLVVVGCPFLVRKGWRQRRMLLRDFDTNEDGAIDFAELRAFVHKNLHFLLDAGAAGALLAAAVGRLRCDDRGELEALAVAGVLLFTNLLNVLMPFKHIGVLVISIYKMLVGDLFRFLVVFAATLAGFACGMLLLVQRSDDLDAAYGASFGAMFLHLLWVALGDGLANIPADLESAALYAAMQIAWVLLSSVLLLNLLIAMMGRTFDRDSEDTHSIWIFPFAGLVLRYERLLSRAERKRHRTGSAASGSSGAGQPPLGEEILVAGVEGGASDGGELPGYAGEDSASDGEATQPPHRDKVVGEGGASPPGARRGEAPPSDAGAGAGDSGDGGGAGPAEQRYVEVDVGEVSPSEEGTARRRARERAEALAAHGPLLDLVEERLAALRRDLLADLRVCLGPDPAPKAVSAAPRALEAADGLAPRRAPPRSWASAGEGGAGGAPYRVCGEGSPVAERAPNRA